MGVGTNGNWDWVYVVRLSGITQKCIGTRQTNPGVLGGGKPLNAEVGKQRVKRRDESGTSRVSEAHWMRVFKNRRGQNIEGYSRDRRPDLVIGTALYQL
jgi:hypothetical protein